MRQISCLVFYVFSFRYISKKTDFCLILAAGKSSFVSTLRSINQSFIKKSLFSAYLPPPKVDNQFDTIDKKFFNPQM